jgi:hypothetical protein
MQYHMCSTRLLLVNVLAVQVYHVRLNLHCPSDSIAKFSPLSYTHWHLITVIALYCVRQPHTILSFSAFADPSSVLAYGSILPSMHYPQGNPDWDRLLVQHQPWKYSTVIGLVRRAATRGGSRDYRRGVLIVLYVLGDGRSAGRI